jgi:hypothetical protein
MPGNFFRRSAKPKQHVSKKQTVEIDKAVSSGSQGKYMKCVSFPLPPLEAALSVFNLGIFSFENNFLRRN